MSCNRWQVWSCWHDGVLPGEGLWDEPAGKARVSERAWETPSDHCHRERPEQLENQGVLDFQRTFLPQKTLSVCSCPHLCSGLSPLADDGAPMSQHPPPWQDHSSWFYRQLARWLQTQCLTPQRLIFSSVNWSSWSPVPGYTVGA